MLIFRYLVKEVFITLIALTAILLLIFMSNQVVVYLNRAASGAIPGVLILQLMALELPNLLSLLLPLGFYVAILLCYGRLYAESEMIVLQASGYGPIQLLKYSLIMAFGVFIVTTLMILASPMIAYERAKILQTTGVKTLIQTVVPGRFRALPGGQQVFYVESMRADHRSADGLFLARLLQEQGKPVWDVLWASRAFLKMNNKTHEEDLVLVDGKKYQGTPGAHQYQVAEFSRYQMHLPHPSVQVKNDMRTLSLTSIWNNLPDKKAVAELQWRISIPFMVLVLTLVAVPLSRVNPRAGKYAKVLPAILIYILYANFMFISRDAVISGKLPAWIGMGAVHVSVALIGMLLMWRNKLKCA